jgi:hypothetical protein
MPNPLAGGPPLVGCPRLLIQYIRSYAPYLEAISSIRNLRVRHAVVTRDPLNMEYLNKCCVNSTLSNYNTFCLATLESFRTYRQTDGLIERFNRCFAGLERRHITHTRTMNNSPTKRMWEQYFDQTLRRCHEDEEKCAVRSFTIFIHHRLSLR